MYQLEERTDTQNTSNFTKIVMFLRHIYQTPLSRVKSILSVKLSEDGKMDGLNKLENRETAALFANLYPTMRRVYQSIMY